MAKAAYYPFFHGPGRGTTKMVWNERRPSGLEVLILIKSPSTSHRWMSNKFCIGRDVNI